MEKYINRAIQEKLILFYQKHDLCQLYKSYDWQVDTWTNGFPKILEIESKMRPLAQRNQVTQESITTIADWGQLLSKPNIRHSSIMTVPVFQENGQLLDELVEEPHKVLSTLKLQTRGLGPTYQSKVLRFLAPKEYGAIDTRIIRIFGATVTDNTKSWLMLNTVADKNGRHAIPETQRGWPEEYSTWIKILRFFTVLANSPETGQVCPHTTQFVERELREKGKWACADIEMALFAYASEKLKRK
jgi:hypothetical protein